MTGATLHVTFGTTAAHSIGEALGQLDRFERVIGLPDDLSFGPINPPSPELRLAWSKSVLHYERDDDLRADGEFWAAATAKDVCPVAWICATYAAEQAGFLEFVWRMAGRPFDIIDATNIEIPSKHGRDVPLRPWSLGIMSPDDIVASTLADRRSACPPERIKLALEMWRGLREENAPFRIVKDGRLVSAPLTYFDAFLQRCAADEWQKATLLIGKTMGWMAFDLNPPGQSPSDAVLFGRVLALGKSGLLDVEGSGSNMRDYRVRRRGAPKPKA